jgi:hypothetical protein
MLHCSNHARRPICPQRGEIAPDEGGVQTPAPRLTLRVPRHRSSTAVDRIGRSACTCIRPQVFQGANKSGPGGRVVYAESLACLLRITPEPT